MSKVASCSIVSLLLPALLYATSTTTTVATSPNPSVFGQSVTFTATVTASGSPVTGGSVDFFDTYGGTTVLLFRRPVFSGQAGLSISGLGVGVHKIIAVYLGFGSFVPSESDTLIHVVNASGTPTTTSLVSSSNPGECGQAVTFTATVTGGGGIPTGTVQFSDNGSPMGGPVMLVSSTTSVTTSSLSLGNHTIRAKYNGDSNFDTSSTSLLQNIQDTTPPTITCPANVLATAPSGQCNAVVSYAAVASDNCSSFSIVCSPSSGSTFSSGTTTVSCTATDASGNASTCSFTVTLSDNQPPSISLSLNPSQLWPPDNKLRNISAIVTVLDNCSGAGYVLSSITSNESGGGGDIQGAIYGTPDLNFELRATRLGKGSGRIYTVTYTAIDGGGNSTSASGTVTVPHDQRDRPFGSITQAPDRFHLEQNHPNPFNPETRIMYSLPEAAHTRLAIYDILGREVKILVERHMLAGHYVALWDATDQKGNPVHSGVYFYRLSAGSFSSIKRMLLMK